MLVETTARQSWRVFLDTVYTYTCYVIESDCVSLSTQVKSHLNLLNRKLISTCHLIHYLVIVYTLNVFNFSLSHLKLRPRHAFDETARRSVAARGTCTTNQHHRVNTA